MIKHRIASLGLGLALLGSLGFAATANAAENDTLTVSAQTKNIITIDVDKTSIDFGQNLNFLGEGAGGDVVGVCTDANGARFIGPNVNVTVDSSTDYSVDRRVDDQGSSPAIQMVNRTWVGEGAFTGLCENPSLGWEKTVQQIWSTDTHMVTNQLAGKDKVHTEFYMIDVVAGDDPGNYSVLVTYEGEALP